MEISMLKNLSIGGRFIVLLVSMFLFLILSGSMFLMEIRDIVGIGIHEIESVMLQGQKDKIEVATRGVALALGEQLQNVDGEEAKIDFIRKSIDKFRFENDKSGYFFVYKGTVNVALPPKKSLHGKDLSGAKDKNGVYFVKDLNEVARNGGGFVEYVFDKPGKGVQPKLGYAILIPGTDMWIGTGVYIDNIEEQKARVSNEMGDEVQSDTTRIILIMLALLLFFVTPLCIVIVRSIVRPVKDATDAASRVAEGDLSVSLNPVAEVKYLLCSVRLIAWWKLLLRTLTRLR